MTFRESIAHARMLAKCRIIPARDARRIIKGLEAIARDLGRGKRLPPEEDIHFAIERELIRRIGPVGGKLHTARSRNDQIALDLKLYLRDQIDLIRPGNRRGCSRRSFRSPSTTWTSSCRASRMSSMPSRSSSAITSWPTPGCWSATRGAWRTPGSARTRCRWEARRWRGRRFRSTAPMSPNCWGLPASRPTRSIPFPTGIFSSNSCRRRRWSWRIFRGWRRN